MSKPLIILISSGILFLAIGMYLAFSAESTQPDSSGRNSAVMVGDSELADNGREDAYIRGNTQTIDAVKSGKRVLFFHATWCPTCRVLDQDIERNRSSIPENMSIIRLDFDESLELRTKYDVVLQHTLVQIDSSGNKIDQWNGSPSLQDIVERTR